MTQRMRILIGYDGSECAEAALDDLQRAGLPKSAEALVVSVTELAYPFPPPSSYEIVELAREVRVPADIQRVYATASSASQEAQALAERAATRLKTNFPGWTINVESAVGSPAWELIKRSDEFKPDLIVVGSQGRSKLERLVLGSVSQRVLTEASCSVRIARGRVEEPDTPVRIVVAVDGSPASKAAVQEVISRLWPQKSEVRLVTVADRLTPTFIGELIPPVGKIVDDLNEADYLWLKKELEELSKQFEQLGAQVARLPPRSKNESQQAGHLRSQLTELTVSTEIIAGNPKQELIKAAERWTADCIFVGSGGFSSRIERFVLGSVSQAVASRANCSVEVVRPR